MTSSIISNSVITSDRSRESKKKRKKKNQIQNQSQTNPINQSHSSTWKTETLQQIYSSKLLHALRHVSTSNSPSSTSKRGQAVRQAADRALAVTAKGKTRWSRAILKNRLKLSFMKRKRVQRIITPPNIRKKNRGVTVVKLKKKSMRAVQRKTRVLGRLVPGCKKQSLPVILEEATDYIPALEMQVKALSALTQLLSGNRLQP